MRAQLRDRCGNATLVRCGGVVPKPSDFAPLLEDINLFKTFLSEKVPCSSMLAGQSVQWESLKRVVTEHEPTYLAAARPAGPAPIIAMLRTLLRAVISQSMHQSLLAACKIHPYRGA